MRHAQKKDRALDDGMRALLRDRIISACDHYLEKGFALCMPGKTSPACMMPTTAWVGMGVTDMVQQTMKLPYKNGGETRSSNRGISCVVINKFQEERRYEHQLEGVRFRTRLF